MGTDEFACEWEVAKGRKGEGQGRRVTDALQLRPNFDE